MSDKRYLLEYFNGCYLPIDTPEELDDFRAKHLNFEGILYTRDGHIVNEEVWRKQNRLEGIEIKAK
jgi:hypothetical protein